MSGLLTYLLAPHEPGLIMLAAAVALPLTWGGRSGPPERACILALGGLAMLDLAAWLIGWHEDWLHAAADSLALSWIMPVALRANCVYPAAIAASLLIAASCQWFQLLGLVRPGGAADLLVGTAHLLALAGYLGGWASQRAGSGRRAAWRDELQAR